MSACLATEIARRVRLQRVETAASVAAVAFAAFEETAAVVAAAVVAAAAAVNPDCHCKLGAWRRRWQPAAIK